MKRNVQILERKSNVELLRIISMLFIIGLHYLGSSNAIENVVGEECNNAYILVETIFGTGVNIFVLITGYFMVDKKRVGMRKVVKLLFDVTFYGVVIFFVAFFLDIVDFSFINLIKSAFPILFGYRWFVKAWIILYVLVPFLNKGLNDLSKKSFKILLAIMILLFSVWPFVLPNPPLDDYGYSFLHFIFIYIIAAYLRKFSLNLKTKTCICMLISAFLATWCIGHCANTKILFLNNMYTYKWALNSPFMIIASCMIFVIALRIGKNFSSKIINTLAASSFGVFLIHGDFNTMGFLFNNICKASNYYDSWLWIPYMSLCVIIIYFVCFCLDYIKQNSVDIIINKIFDRINLFNYYISI